jgi:hypothetical protein
LMSQNGGGKANTGLAKNTPPPMVFSLLRTNTEEDTVQGTFLMLCGFNKGA